MRSRQRLSVGGSMASLLVLALLGCGSAATSPQAPTDQASPAGTGTSAEGDGSKLTVDVAGGSGSGATLAPGIDWPAGVPADIPPFPGNVKMLMPQQTETERGIWVRIFCDGVSPEQFAQYVAELRAGGYSIKGTVYYSGADEKAEAERRAAAGDLDEIAATLGDRLLTITVPKSTTETITYDMDGLTRAEAEAVTGETW